MSSWQNIIKFPHINSNCLNMCGEAWGAGFMQELSQSLATCADIVSVP